MNKTNIKILFVAAILAIIYGSYTIAKTVYVKTAWDEVEGVVVGFERNTWSCGKGIGECYSLVIGYKVNNKTFSINSDKKWNYDPPEHLLKDKVSIYYSPSNPNEAIVGSGFGTNGFFLILFGSIVLIFFWFARKRGEI